MPQLDKATFFTQIFWLFASFSLLYVAASTWALPTISKILKVRNKHLSTLELTSLNLDREVQSTTVAREMFHKDSLGRTLLHLRASHLESVRLYKLERGKIFQRTLDLPVVPYLYGASRVLRVHGKG